MMSLTFGLFTQVSGSGPLGPLVLLHHLMMLYIFTKFQENISKGLRVIKWMRYGYRNLQRCIILFKLYVEL